ncbi:hypothetical protein FOA52_011676 [Chlamydomonas sp. UWO 241]|nr:hypothetical protein FOA52_011676 [Chlamydomonas sp. UWO 241]
MQAPAVPSWQRDGDDTSIRKDLKQQIFAIFTKKHGTIAKLDTFVPRLEAALYGSSSSKEEYMDSSTLEARLADVARRHGKRSGPGPGPESTSSAAAAPAHNGQMPGMPIHGAGGMVPNAGAHHHHSALGMGMHGMGMGMGATMMHNGVPVMRGGNDAMRQPYSNVRWRSSVLQVVQFECTPMGASAGMPYVPSSSGGGMGVPGGHGMVPNGMVPNGMAPNGMGHNEMGHNGTGHSGMGHSQPGGAGMGHGVMVPTSGPGGPVGPGMVPQGMVPIGASGGGAAHPGGASSSAAAMGGGAGVGTPPPPPPPQQQQLPGGTADGVKKQQRWLLFLRHCAKCRQPESECSLTTQCKFGKQLWSHILHCATPSCDFPRCSNSKELLKHHQKCVDARCPICVPVKEYVKRTRQSQVQAANNGDGQLGVKPQGMMRPNGMAPPHPGMGGGRQGYGGQQGARGSGVHPGMHPGMVPQQQQGGKRSHNDGFGGFSAQPGMHGGAPQFAGGLVPGMQANGGDEQQGQQGQHKRARTGEPLVSKNTGTSLLETFTAEQIRVHNKQIHAAGASARALLPPGTQPSETCGVCGIIRLTFEPPVIYCMACGLKIKRGQTFYTTPEINVAEIKGAWCHSCFTEAKPEKILLEGSTYKKADLVKKKNEHEEEESWVQCDNCQIWVHQICGLFNKGRNNQNAHYLCPECLLEGIDTGVRQRIEVRPQSMLDAKELPVTRLSKFLEDHMASAIQHERCTRAQAKGVDPREVLGAENLSVRVINNIMKKCEAKPRYADSFGQTDNYPTSFPYRQRVIVLFQNIEGVDVCLFVMYVQEYGPECPAPNTNVVYLSYLDSIRYFRPDGMMASGCPNPNTQLRTFVYHQLQVAYLMYVKKLGFEQMYIWACPPMAGDDYILYCHPSKQKTPRSDRLRAWYIDMLKDARARGIVVHLSTLWDTFFDGGKDHRMDRISSTFIPYLDGDYWPGEAENLLGLIESGGGKGGKKESNALLPGGARKPPAKGKRSGLGAGGSPDEQLMSRLGDILGGNMKEDFIVVHLKEVCTFCRTHVEGGIMYRYTSATPLKSNGGRTFEGVKIEGGPSIPSGTVTHVCICEACYADEQRRFVERGGIVRLPQGLTPDRLEPFKVSPVEGRIPYPDADTDMACEHFETRQSFLNLCQGNHYQFDTLRRAKHSSMMVLYHLHNPEAAAFAVSCNVCTAEIEAGTGFRCTACPDFEICAVCQQHAPYSCLGGRPHQLVKHVRRMDETRMRLTEGERKERSEQLQRTMALLVHACACRDVQCPSHSCRKVRELFQHANTCQIKVGGGCQLCKKVLVLLNLHAKSCSVSVCPVPRCREFKELRRRQANRQEEQRRKAYAHMLKAQQAQQQQGVAG